MNKIIKSQLKDIKKDDFCTVKIVKVKERDMWYGQKKIVCKMWNNYGTNIRIMFMSVDDKTKYMDFDLGDKTKSWLFAESIYICIPKIVNNDWFEEYGFEDF